MTSETGTLSVDHLRSWSENGFFRLPRFTPAATCNTMLQRATEIVRDDTLAAEVGAKVMREKQAAGEHRTFIFVPRRTSMFPLTPC